MSHLGTKLDAGAWVVVCDGRKALLLANIGDELYPNLRTFEVHEQENPPTSQQGSDAPGRVHESATAARSAVETTDWHDQAERAFLRRIVARLDKALQAGETHALIIVAPPRALGVIRPLYTHAISRALAAEVDRDLVRLPVYEIEKMLAA
ncbi:host attachment family protein [Starkeya sp. ORNL1]|uniref:baeRF12 domain-containing protein n=1 Tax=Starkeya sp. ORNL1 TaxID=2709380 RepID=UPI001FEFA03B|nr:host attachment family protein [Starkeya sp. ORNL1]